LGALVLALRGAGGWEHCGQVGTGFGEAAIADLRRRMAPLRRPTSALAVPPALAEPLTWVEPLLVCEVRHAGWTRAGVLRHPTFLALREDAAPEDCVREEVADVSALVSEGEEGSGSGSAREPAAAPPAAAPVATSPELRPRAVPSDLPPRAVRPELPAEVAEA